MKDNELKIAVVDDKKADSDRIRKIIEDKLKDDYTLKIFTSGEEFLESFAVGKFDIIFMDIYMKLLTGVETIKEVRNRDSEVFIAFVSTSEEFAMEAYRLRVNRYISKPYDKAEIEEILSTFADSNEEKTLLLGANKNTKIKVNDIVCVEQTGHNLSVFLTNKEEITVRDKISEVIKALSDESNFYHCHKSFVVNIAHVTGLEEEFCFFTTDIDKNVHIRRDDIHKARRYYTEYRLNSIRNEK